MKNRKIVVTVAPVCHVGKEIPSACFNPLTPQAIAEDTANCAKAGASQVHLHTRELNGEPTFDLAVFSQTLDLICAKTDIILQGSTGGLSTLSLEERCVCLNEPRVEVASLNMGSVNFGEAAYVNTLPDIRFWAARMKEKRIVPELEIFDLSMVETCHKLADEGVLSRPLHYNFCLGTGVASNLSDTPRNLLYMSSLTEANTHWGLNNDQMQSFSMLACAIAMGASVVRVGFEDSFFYAPGKLAASNAVLVEKVVALIRSMGHEPATPAEARQLFGIDKLRGL